MENVANNKDFFAAWVWESFLDGKGIKEGLGRVSVGSVSCIDDRCAGEFSDRAGEAGGFVANDDKIGSHGLKGFYGFADRFAFRDGGLRDIEIRDICGEAFCGDLKRGVGACAWLVEEHEYGFAFECRHFFYRAGKNFLKRDGLIEELINVFPSKARDV